MSKVTVNAMGKQCPIPVVEAKKALSAMTEAGTLEVLVDNEIAVQNLLRLASGSGLQAKSEKIAHGQFTVTMEVSGKPAGAPQECLWSASPISGATRWWPSAPPVWASAATNWERP